jgi:hypothetical protein
VTGGIVWIWIFATAGFLMVGVMLTLWGRGRWFLRVGGVVAGSFPGGTLLAGAVPWWDFDHRGPAWGVTLIAATLLLAAVALAGPWQRHRFGPAVVVAVATALLLAVDVTTGSHLQLNSLLGYNPIVAGRFTGFGNMPFGIYAASGLIAVAAAVHRQPPVVARWLAVVAGGTLVVLDGTPGIGADFGGVLALVPALMLLAMITTGVRLSAARVIGALAAGVAAVTVIAIADYQRSPDNQTHLGRFVGQLLDGTAWEVLERKADANWYILLHSSVALLAPVMVIILIGLFGWPNAPGRLLLAESSPAALAAAVSVGSASLLGTLLNDSGIAVFVAAGCVVIPLVMASAAGDPRSRQQIIRE